MPLVMGQILNNRYHIVSQIAVGGFGTVYRAWDTNLNRPCAVKENLENTPEAQRQFTFEARVLVQLHHPNLPAVFDHFILPGQGQYLVMEFIEGEDLETIRGSQGGMLAEPQVLPWTDQIFDALSYLHQQTPPIIHRDVKPSNIRITPQGKAVLVDFGIAKEYVSGKLTTGYAKSITPGFSPPEQYTGAGTTERSDIYALGATLYTLLTGVDLPESIHRMMGQNKTRPPHALREGISPQVSAAVMRAIQPDPSLRFATVEEFKASLHDRNGGRHNELLVKVAVASVALIAILAAGLLMNRPDPPPAASRLAPEMPSPSETVPAVAAPTKEAIPPVKTVVDPAAKTQSTDAVSSPTPVPSPLPGSIDGPTLTPWPSITPPVHADRLGVPMVLIPAGPFTMGGDVETARKECFALFPGDSCDPESYTDETPAHVVELDDYFIDRTEVTNGMYAKCVEAGACRAPTRTRSNTNSSYFGSKEFANYPVIYVTWGDAQSFCTWRGARLPSEAEWEKAARGVDGRIYPWGNSFNGAWANFCGRECEFEWANRNITDGYADTAPVDAYPDGASAYGVLGLAGNVWEWTADWYGADYYGSSPGQNPRGPTSGADRVIRGGAWNTVGSILRAGTRERENPNGNFYNIGFRCAASP